VWVAAGVRGAGAAPRRVLPLAAPLVGHAPRLEEKARAVAKTLGRKDRKTLAGIADRLTAVDLGAWIAAVRATHRRAALLVCGDAPIALRRGEGTPPAGAGPAALDVVAWSVSESCLFLRKDLGL